MTSGIPSWKKNVHQSMTPETWRGVPVPWAALWSAEQEIDRENHILIWKQGKLAYADEIPGDRRLGVLWCRHKIGSHGEPLFGQLHTARQRLAMIKSLCQVCGGTAVNADGRISWLISADSDTSWTMTPPTCEGCQPGALRYCPHLTSKPPVRLTVGLSTPIGVLGDVYQVEGNRFTSVNPRAIVDFHDDDGMRRVLAKQLVVQLHDPQVVE
jgi:hypothetical protein